MRFGLGRKSYSVLVVPPHMSCSRLAILSAQHGALGRVFVLGGIFQPVAFRARLSHSAAHAASVHGYDRRLHPRRPGVDQIWPQGVWVLKTGSRNGRNPHRTVPVPRGSERMQWRRGARPMTRRPPGLYRFAELMYPVMMNRPDHTRRSGTKTRGNYPFARGFTRCR
jgi:hypothetical protein